MKAIEDQRARRPHELPDLVEPPARPEMDSVTDVNGTVARFEMAYSPIARRAVSFGPPLRQRLPSLVFCAFGAVLVGLVDHRLLHRLEQLAALRVGRRRRSGAPAPRVGARDCRAPERDRDRHPRANARGARPSGRHRSSLPLADGGPAHQALGVGPGGAARARRRGGHARALGRDLRAPPRRRPTEGARRFSSSESRSSGESWSRGWTPSIGERQIA